MRSSFKTLYSGQETKHCVDQIKYLPALDTRLSAVELNNEKKFFKLS
jgi:hypothetical protein